MLASILASGLAAGAIYALVGVTYNTMFSTSRVMSFTAGQLAMLGGVFGSMLSTPIINPPQSAILGVHATKERAVVENGQVVVRPMNYLALSYDHRIIDGREAVLSLVAMKEALEDPARLVLEV